MDDSTDIERLADELLPARWEKKRDLIVLVGEGGEALAHEICARGGTKLIVLAQTARPESLPPVTKLVRSLDELERAVLSFRGDPARAITRKLAECPSPELYQQACLVVRNAVGQAKTQKETIDAFGEMWVLQGIRNLPNLARFPSIDVLRDSFRGKPMAIVAPGPSLAKNVHLLPGLSGKAILVTFSHTLTALWRAGVVPDLVMAVDPEDLRYHFEELPREYLSKLGALVLGSRVHPDVFELPVQRIFTIASDNSLDDWLFQGMGDIARLNNGGSVAHCAMSMGILWGSNPVIFVGHDLSFGDGRYYISTSCDGNTRVKVATSGQKFITEGFSEGFGRMETIGGAKTTAPEPLVYLTGYYGGKVQSSFAFQSYLAWFEKAALSLAGQVRLLNCTEGGARIVGMEQIPLAAAIAECASSSIDIGVVLDRALESNPRAAFRNIMRARMDAMLPALDATIDLAEDCIAVAEQVLAQTVPMEVLDARERELTRALRPITFMSLLMQEEIRKAKDTAQEATTLEETLVASKTMYRIVYDAGIRIRPVLVDSFRKLDSGSALVG